MNTRSLTRSLSRAQNQLTMKGIFHTPAVTGITAIDAELTRRFPEIATKSDFDRALLRQLVEKYIADHLCYAQNILRETNLDVVDYLSELAMTLRRLELTNLQELSEHLDEQRKASLERMMKKL